MERPSPDRQLLHYRLVSPLGRGGMGEVWRAFDTKLEREVAIKILPEDVADDPERLARLEREAKAIARVSHPNIITVHAVEETGGIRFVAMELVRGRALGEWIPRDGLEVGRFLELAIPLADAVAAAHRAGVTHRDLKPANVMVTEEGTVKVLDFGLAKLTTGPSAADDPTRLTTEKVAPPGRIMGTAAYMSPEQAEGKPVDHRSDVFSLGVVYYEMLTGRRPFHGDTLVSLLSSIMKDTPASVTERKSTLPHGAGRIIRRCLEKDPGRRYQTAVDLRNDLEDLKIEVDSGVVLRPVAAPRPFRGRVRAALAATAVAAAVLLAVFLVRDRVGRGKSPPVPPAEPSAGLSIVPITRTGTAVSAAISPDAKYVVYVVSEGGHRSLRVRQLATGSDREILPPMEAAIFGPQVSPDGAWVYYGVWDHGGTVYRLPILGGHPQKVLEDVDGGFDLAPGGDRIAFQTKEGPHVRVRVADIDGSHVRDLVEHPEGMVDVLAWSSDGLNVFFNGTRSANELGSILREVAIDDGTVRDVGSDVWQMLDLTGLPGESGVLIAGFPGGTALQRPPQLWRVGLDGQATRVTHGIDTYLFPSLDRSGRTLVAIENRSERSLRVLPGGDQATARRVAFTSRAGIYWCGVAWTPDGRLVYEDLDGENLQIWVANADGSQAEKLARTGGLNMGAAVSPDGGTVAYFSDRSGGFRIWLSDFDGGNARRLTDAKMVEAFPRFSADGRWIVYHVFAEDGTEHIRKAPVAGGASIQLTDYAAYMPVVSHDGRRIAFATGQSNQVTEIAIADFDTGEVLSRIPHDFLSGIPFIQWTPGDRGLAAATRTGGGFNIIVHPLDGGPTRQITHFTEEAVLGFDWAPDGSSLAVVTSKDSNDAVRITGLPWATAPPDPAPR